MSWADKWRVFFDIEARRARSEPLSLPDAAQAYAEAGFKLTAVEAKGKQPILLDHVTFAPLQSGPSYWDEYPNANIGLLTGEDFWVLDIDGQRGFKSLQWLEQVLHIGNIDIFCVKTGKGAHLYWRSPVGIAVDSFQIPNTVSLLPGIDVRGVNGQVLVPPSIHASDKEYVLHSGVTSPEPPYAPRELMELVMNAEPLILRPRPVSPSTQRAAEIFDFTKTSLEEYDAEKAARATQGSQPPPAEVTLPI